MAAQSTEVAEYDRRWAEGGYGASHAGYTPNFVRFLMKHASLGGAPAGPNKPVVGDHRALDVGCGDGYFSRALREQGYAVTGIDLSPVGVEQTRAVVPDGQFLTHDLGEPFPFDDGTFDVVWCSEVLEHLFSPLFALQQIRRVLKPGGKLLATVPYHGLIKNVGIAMLAFDRHYDPEYPHLRFFTKNTLRRVAEKAGLQIVELTHCGSSMGMRDWFVPTNILMCARKP